MAGKFGSASGLFLVDGYSLLAMKLKTLSHKIEAIQERSDGIGDGAEESTPVGMSRFTVSQGGGFFDTGTNNSHAALNGGLPTSPQSAKRVVCAGFAGNVLAAPFYGLEGVHQFTYDVMGIVGELTKANAEYKTDGQLDKGQIVQPLDTKTADWNTELTSVDYAADTTQRVIPITSNSQANPSVVTTPVPHGLTTGEKILISGVSGSSPDINGEQAVTVIDETSFSVAVDTSSGSGGTGGSFVKADSANGGVGYLHVTAASGFTNFVGKLRDSPDDVTFADLITFSDNVSAPFSERLTVAGVIDRYTAFDGDVTGTGSITAFCGLARNP